MLHTACAVKVGEARFFRPQDADNFTMDWTYTGDEGPTLTGEAARAALFAEKDLVQTNATLDTPSGTVELMHIRQDDPDRPLLVYCGGTSFDYTRHSDTTVYIFESFGDLLFWNYPGYGNSEGEPSRASLSAAGDALLARLSDFRRPGQRVVFYGHSMGSFVCAELAARYPDTSALILEATAPSTADAAAAFGRFATRGLLRVRLSDKAENTKLAELLADADHPILILGAKHDRILPAPLGRKLATQLEAAQRDVRYVEYDRANHFLIPLQATFEDDVSALLGQEPKGRMDIKLTFKGAPEPDLPAPAETAP